MKLIKPYVELVEEKDLEKRIELCGRVCYKSEDRIDGESAGKFINNIILKRGHTSVLEHARIVFEARKELVDELKGEIIQEGNKKKYFISHFNITRDKEGSYYISANMRTLREWFISNDRKYTSLKLFDELFNKYNAIFGDIDKIKDNELVELEKDKDLAHIIYGEADHLEDIHRLYHQYYTVRIICDRGISHELVRNRTLSPSQESTRYCNYSKDKFGNEITFIIPFWFRECIGLSNNSVDSNIKERFDNWLISCQMAENKYIDNMKKFGGVPQEDRSILPNSLKTEIVLTGTTIDWINFFNLRCDTPAHPQMREVSIQILRKLEERDKEIFKEVHYDNKYMGMDIVIEI